MAIRKKAEPKLLSGGNPQIPKGDGDGPVQDYIAAMPDWKRAAGEALDRLIEARVPGVRKAVKWNSPMYGAPEGKSWFLSFHVFAKYVKVAFFCGVKLTPELPVGSKDPNTRYFHIVEGEPIDEELVGGWIEQAVKLPGWTP